jgi:phage gp36-like protein
MAYATIADVTALNRERTIGASTIPNTTDVAQFLEDCAGQIDSVLLGAGYQLPVDAPNVGGASSAWAVLKSANAAGGHYRTEWAAQASDKRTEAEDMWQSALKMLKATQLDIPTNDAESLPRGPTADTVGTPFFYRDQIM